MPNISKVTLITSRIELIFNLQYERGKQNISFSHVKQDINQNISLFKKSSS